jgi:hypothetical protein
MQRTVIKVSVENGASALYQLLHARIDNLRLAQTHPFDLIRMLFSYEDNLLLLFLSDNPIDGTKFHSEIDSLAASINEIHKGGVRIQIITDTDQVEDIIQGIQNKLEEQASLIEKSLEGAELPVSLICIFCIDPDLSSGLDIAYGRYSYEHTRRK